MRGRAPWKRDERGAERFEVGDEIEGAWSREQLQRMDAAFSRALRTTALTVKRHEPKRGDVRQARKR